MTPDPNMPTSLLAMLIMAIVALAGAIVWLFKYHTGKIDKLHSERIDSDAQHAKERLEWSVERARATNIEAELRAEFEARHRQVVDLHAANLRELYESTRQEYAANMEAVAAKAAEASVRVADVLNKLYERQVGAVRRSLPKG